MRETIYTIVSQIKSLELNRFDGSQSNAYTRVQDAEAIQCQKQYRHFVVVLLLAFCYMLSLEVFKKSLGKRAELLTEVEIKNLFELQYKLADTLFTVWVKQHKPIATKITTHKQNGNCVFVWTLNPLYAIA